MTNTYNTATDPQDKQNIESKSKINKKKNLVSRYFISIFRRKKTRILLEQEISSNKQNRNLEIVAFSKELKKFDVSFTLLTENKPDDEDDRIYALSIAKSISNSASLKEILLKTKKLPCNELINTFDYKSGFISKYKSYLVAISLLLIGPYNELQNYLIEGLNQ
ncbi:hypothetical protein [Bacillus toyonensis]|uniref:hypothetical protein n=1 Tax=Bacillus toyonensis TaxID=155322 RepID=UPI002E20FE43|nr:hypothetical protein [Bacillus toyonensis]